MTENFHNNPIVPRDYEGCFPTTEENIITTSTPSAISTKNPRITLSPSHSPPFVVEAFSLFQGQGQTRFPFVPMLVPMQWK